MTRAAEALTKGQLQAWLDHERAGVFSSAIGRARLHLRRGAPDKALEALDGASKKSNELWKEATKRWHELDEQGVPL